MERISESDLYAELVAAHKRHPPVQEGDITIDRFARDTGLSTNWARMVLEKEVRQGKLERVKRTVESGKWAYVYVAVSQDGGPEG